MAISGEMSASGEARHKYADSNAVQAVSSFGLTGKNSLVYQAIKSYEQTDGISRHVLKSKFAHISSQEFQ